MMAGGQEYWHTFIVRNAEIMSGTYKKFRK
jgi:hypothetical protein